MKQRLINRTSENVYVKISIEKIPTWIRPIDRESLNANGFRDSSFCRRQKESDNALAFLIKRDQRVNACNANKATRSIEMAWRGQKKRRKGIFPKPLEGEKKRREGKKRKKEDAKEILYCWKLVVNRKGMNEGETSDRFIGVGLHKKSVLCAV